MIPCFVCSAERFREPADNNDRCVDTESVSSFQIRDRATRQSVTINVTRGGAMRVL